MLKKIIHVYKDFDQWKNSPPGLGDFLRGSCHLHDFMTSKNIDFKIDISQTDFSNHINFNANIFTVSNASDINNANEYFTDHSLLMNDLNSFIASDKEYLYISTNLGLWNRLDLPGATKSFMSSFYDFNADVYSYGIKHTPVSSYEVLSIRCGDKFYGNSIHTLDPSLIDKLFKLIDYFIVPNLKHPLFITSDSFLLKKELAEKYGFLIMPHYSEHGAFNKSTFPVCVDMNLLKNSKFNYHINLWANWWSGFSHYTSLIFTIPSMNFRAPDFICEKLSFNP
jgi:hypothetical protein